jgi:glycolate oxidase FAD binding subunit
MDRDDTEALVAQVTDATARGTPLRVTGGDTKRFFGRTVSGEPLSVQAHRGILRHDPAELVITARAGTPLDEIESQLEAAGQRLPFEPPHFGRPATIGGTIAAGLAGPARAWSGPARDYVLGAVVLAGDGRVLRFGGEVMKNVAGYDLARVMAGSLGILGVLLEVSLKVLPRAAAERTLALDMDERAALERLGALAGSALPLTAGSWIDGRLYLRFEGSAKTLASVTARVGGELLDDGASFWTSLREQSHGYFAGPDALWRITLPPAAAVMALGGPVLLEWNGQQRWCRAGADAPLHEAAANAGGHATLFRNAPRDCEVFAPLAGPLLRVHRELKRVFDPAGILNPGRMYAEL